jgi:hypothetical protein
MNTLPVEKLLSSRARKRSMRAIYWGLGVAVQRDHADEKLDAISAHDLSEAVLDGGLGHVGDGPRRRRGRGSGSCRPY